MRTQNKPNLITFTGLDKYLTIPQEILYNSPEVRFGILIDEEKFGLPRYTSLELLYKLVYDICLPIDLHLCKNSCLKFIKDYKNSIIYKFLNGIHRIQLNLNFAKNNIDPEEIISLSERINNPLILQYNNNNAKFIKDILSYNQLYNIHFLFDESLGKGVEIDKINSPLSINELYINDGFEYYHQKPLYCGYAGGIHLRNIEKIINSISSVNDNYWIDIETGCRENNEFSIELIQQIYEKVKSGR